MPVHRLSQLTHTSTRKANGFSLSPWINFHFHCFCLPSPWHFHRFLSYSLSLVIWFLSIYVMGYYPQSCGYSPLHNMENHVQVWICQLGFTSLPLHPSGSFIHSFSVKTLTVSLSFSVIAKVLGDGVSWMENGHFITESWKLSIWFFSELLLIEIFLVT